RAFSQRLFGDQLLELRDDDGVAAQLEIRIDSLLEGGEALFLQSGNLGPCPRFVRELRERRSSPERKRRAQVTGRTLRIAARKQLLTGLCERLEPMQVELVVFDAKDVSRLFPEEPCADPVALVQDLAQARDVHVEHACNGSGRFLTPDVVDDSL